MRVLVGEKNQFFVLPASARWNEPGQGGWVVKEIWRSPRRQSTGRLFGPVTCVCGRFEKFQSRVYSKIFMPFQLKLANQISYIENFLCLFKLKLTNQISYVSVGAEKMK